MQVPDQQGSAGNLGRSVAAYEPLYTRPMPGGGCVRVEVVSWHEDDMTAEHVLGRVIIERRAAARAMPAEAPLVLEEIEGDDVAMLTAELFRIARDNAAIARRMMRKRVPRAD